MNKKLLILFFIILLIISLSGCGRIEFSPPYIPPPPIITEVTNNPTQIEPKQPVTVKAKIYALNPPFGIDGYPYNGPPNTICKAYLFYQTKYNGKILTYKALPMIKTTQPDIFQATIPGFPKNTEVTYHISATDCFNYPQAGINNNIALEIKDQYPGLHLIYQDPDRPTFYKEHKTSLLGETNTTSLPDFPETKDITGQNLIDDLDLLTFRLARGTLSPTISYLTTEMKVKGEISSGGGQSACEDDNVYLFLIQNMKRPDDPQTPYINEGTFALMYYIKAPSFMVPLQSIIDIEETQRTYIDTVGEPVPVYLFGIYLGSFTSSTGMELIIRSGDVWSNRIKNLLYMRTKLSDFWVSPTTQDSFLGDYIISSATGMVTGINPTIFCFKDLSNSVRLYFREHKYTVGG